MYFSPGFGYHVDNTVGIAKGNDPESIFAVMSGTHTNGGCCFDYGNSESNDRDDGDGTMEAIYFGTGHWRGNSGAGAGPWVGADLEQGMYYGGGNVTVKNEQNTPVPFPFVTAYLRGRTDGFMLKAGDATKGTCVLSRTTLRCAYHCDPNDPTHPTLRTPHDPTASRPCTTARAPLSASCRR